MDRNKTNKIDLATKKKQGAQLAIEKIYQKSFEESRAKIKI